MNVWHAGADGVYLFNSCGPTSSAWKELGDRKVLARLDKNYFRHSDWRVLLGGDLKNQERCLEVPRPPFPERPEHLEAGESHTAEMIIGDDTSTNTDSRWSA